MKKMKKFMLVAIMLLMGNMTVNAASIKVILTDGTTKSYNIKESEYSKTVYDFKKDIESDVNIKADYQVLEYEGFPESDSVILANYFQSSYGYSLDEITYNLYERKELEGTTLTLYSIPPESNIESYYNIIEGVLMRNYPGYTTDPSLCNSDMTECMIKISSNNEDYKSMKIQYSYNEEIKKEVDKLIENVKKASIETDEDEYRFALNDLELINYWVNGGSIINYSNVYKKALNYKNIYLDIKGGDANPLYTISFGIGYYKINNTLYNAVSNIGIDTKHILYVPNETNNDNILTNLQERIDNFVGKNIVTIRVLTSEEINNLNIEFINAEHERMSCDGKIYEASINNEKHYFIVGKDTSKMSNPDVITSDFTTDITVSFKDGSIPLDTMVEIKKLTNGETYEKIMKILNNVDGEMFDISLFAKSINKYITKLSDGSFEVRIPIKEELKGSNLVAYYVNDEGKVEEYDVTIESNTAVFKTNHFSIYTLAKKVDSKKDIIDNPETSDKIIFDIILGISSLLGIALTTKLLRK